MLWMSLPVLDIIHLQNNKFVPGVKITRAIGDSHLNDNPGTLS